MFLIFCNDIRRNSFIHFLDYFFATSLDGIQASALRLHFLHFLKASKCKNVLQLGDGHLAVGAVEVKTEVVGACRYGQGAGVAGAAANIDILVA